MDSMHCETDEQGRIDGTAWLAEWQLRLRLLPSSTAGSIIYLGWTDSIEDVVTPVRAKIDDWSEFGVWHNSSVHVFVMGSKGVGKVRINNRNNKQTSLIRRLMSMPVAPCYDPTTEYQTSVAAVSRGHGEMGTLCVTEVCEQNEDECIECYSSLCDLFCIVVEISKPQSILTMERIVRRLPKNSKVVIVETKSDLMKKV